MNSFVNFTFVILSILSLTYFLNVLWNLGKTLIKFHQFGITTTTMKDDPLNSVLTDLGLICLFIFQHKFTAIINAILKGTPLEPLCRSFYIFTTALVLETLHFYWAITPDVILWDFSTVLPVWLLPSICYFLLVLYFLQFIMLDLPLFLGLKQTWYSLQGLADPTFYKSLGYQRFISHSSHPVLALLLVLWLRTTMSLDGFILACGMSAFATQKQVDQHDKAYVQRQTRERSMKMT